MPELIDFYGHHGFDCICITDHLADPRRLIGKLSELASFSLGQNQVGEYFEVIEQERRRAWRKYGLLVMTGLEFNKDGYTKKSSGHLGPDHGATQRSLNRHRGRANVTFCDGHVEGVKLPALFSNTAEEALRRWNKDNLPHRETVSSRKQANRGGAGSSP